MGSANPEQRNWISGEDEEAYLYAMQLASASVMPMVIKSAIELDLLELIKKAGPGAHVSPSQLAAQLPTMNPLAPLMLDRILRLLATHSILTCNLPEDGGIERLYGLAPVCDFLTKNEDGVSMAALLLLNRDRLSMGSWYHLKDAILDGGIPFNKAYGMSVFEYHGTQDPRFKNLFNQAMSHSTITMKKILNVYNGFQGLNTLVDVGGGTGATLDMIVSKYPTIRAVNFDLPHVVQDAPTYPSVDHIGGDMFVTVPKGDAIFMKWICHNWSDEQCLKLLNKCYEALPENGKVIVAESIVPDAPDAMLSTQIALHYDVIMLAQTPGGKERTEKEFKALANGAGFKHFSKICCAYNTWIMEFLK